MKMEHKNTSNRYDILSTIMAWALLALIVLFGIKTCSPTKKPLDQELREIYAGNTAVFDNYVNTFLMNTDLYELRYSELPSGDSLITSNTFFTGLDKKTVTSDFKYSLGVHLITADKSVITKVKTAFGTREIIHTLKGPLKSVRFYSYSYGLLDNGLGKGIEYFHVGKPELTISNLDNIPSPLAPKIHDGLPVHSQISGNWYLFLQY